MSRSSREKAISYLDTFMEFLYFTLYNSDEGYLGTKFDGAFKKSEGDVVYENCK
jgi:hypothetical protein